MPSPQVARNGAVHVSVGTEAVILGVVIDLPEPQAGELRRHREAIGDPQADAIPAHVTLLPPTEVPRTALEGIEEHLAGVAATLRPFPVRLDGAATFRPVSPVVFVRVAAGVEQLDDVQRAIRQGELDRELPFTFHPHVTVAHKLDDAALDRALDRLADYADDFTVDGFLLYEQDAAGEWRPRRRYVFTADGPVPA